MWGFLVYLNSISYVLYYSRIPRISYFLLPLETKQEAASGWNLAKYILGVKVIQLKVRNAHVKMGTSSFKYKLSCECNNIESDILDKIVIFF